MFLNTLLILSSSNLTLRILQHNYFVTIKIQLCTTNLIRSFDILEVSDTEVTNVIKNLDMRIIKTKMIKDMCCNVRNVYKSDNNNSGNSINCRNINNKNVYKGDNNKSGNVYKGENVRNGNNNINNINNVNINNKNNINNGKDFNNRKKTNLIYTTTTHTNLNNIPNSNNTYTPITNNINNTAIIYLLTGRYLKNKFLINKKYIIIVYLINNRKIYFKPFYLAQLDLSQTSVIPMFIDDCRRKDFLKRCIQSNVL